MNKLAVFTLEDAKKKLESYCAYQERCHKEVQQKLKDMRMIPEAIDVIIVHLIKHNFLNEERFAKSFARGKFRIKKWGKNKIRLELKRKDISPTNINTALKEIDDLDYLETFNTLAQKKALTLQHTTTLKKRKKLADYLLYHGWESHLVYQKVNELIK